MPTPNLQSYKVLFLSEDNLKEYTILRDDIDMSVLTPIIRSCQGQYIFKLLGSSLYTDLQNKVLAGTLNLDELTLLQIYIIPTLAWCVMKTAPVLISYKFTNRGVTQMTGQESQPSNMSDLQTLGDMANLLYEAEADKLVKYLIANAQLFPAYRLMTAYNDVSPATNGWDSRIALGNQPYRGYLQQEVGGSASQNITPAMFAYFNVSKIITASSHTGNTAIFNGSFLPAPSGLPGTSKSNFAFFVNGTAIPVAAVSSFTDNGNGTCTLAVDTTILGFSFQVGDTISSAGKYA